MQRNQQQASLAEGSLAFLAATVGLSLVKNDVFEQCNSCDVNEIEWIIDSGCTEHIIQDCYEKHMTHVQTLDNVVKTHIANGDFLIASKRGTIQMKSEGNNITLEALIVKNVKFNLLSVKKIV
ncbi:hypothetical protein QE152_g18972 [Popillia japonica]|uniref:Retrovirus-related Pol polyprotein from transposon TNT 1-94-like beta-barrel domain-containing protein n=1 Tax=Popillia japonica TaxID=7064 RepID=A0AAW1L4W4_POPJA